MTHAGSPRWPGLLCSDGSHYEKRGKGDPVCIDDEIPFETPKSWEWCRFETVITIASNLVNPDGYQDLPHIAPDNIEKGTGNLLQYRTVGEDKVKSGNHLFHEGQILYSKIRPALRKAVLAPCDGLCSADMYPLSSPLDSAYLLALLLSDYFTSQTLKDDTRVKMPKTNQAALNAIIVPVPPLTEQIRIGKRLSTITPLIDQYGALEEARERLDAELPDRMRKSILQLAVQGRLVEQDPADEPASALLERIRAERATLVKAKKIRAPKSGESVIYRASDGGYYEKRGKGEPVCIDDEIPFDIPESWAWVRLESIMALSSGIGYKKPDLSVRSDRMIRVLRGGNISTADEIIMHDSDVFIAEQFVDPSLLLRPGQLITPAVTSLENVGKAALVRDSIPDTVCGGFVFYLTPFLQEPWFSEYLYLWLIAPAHRAFCKASVKKSGQAFYNLSKTSLNSALIALPPMEEQKRISQACRKLLTQLTNQ